MQTLVIGASGIVGGYIVEQLVRHGGQPLAMSRQPQQSADVAWLQGDLADPAALNIPPVDTIYCTADISLLADAVPLIATPALKRIIAFTSTSIVTKIG
jgi:putative NADH-flavin reductase